MSKKRLEVFEGLQKAGIGVQVHYIPVYMHPYYQGLGYKKGICPLAEEFYESEISIPIYPGLSLADQRSIVLTLKNILNA